MQTTPPADAIAIRLFETLEAVADPGVRVSWLRSGWARGPAASVAGVLEAAAAFADAGLERYREGLLYLVVALAPDELAEVRRSAARHAIGNRLHAARSLLVPASRTTSEPSESKASGLAVSRTITLGQRKSLARAPSPAALERIALDPHPDVIRILLSNPALRESDVLRIAAKRPVPEAILREVFVHPRWFVRYPVRLALVQNPNLPTDLGLALIRRLFSQDARMVAEATDLPVEIREAARAELARPSLH